MAGRGIKLRTRALSTTLFARLLRAICSCTASAARNTTRSPITSASSSSASRCPSLPPRRQRCGCPSSTALLAHNELRRVSRELRELDYHPERFLSRDGAPSANNAADAAKFATEKRRWIDTPVTPENAHTRHLAISSANAALQPFVRPQRQQLHDERAPSQRRLRDDAILNSREFAFCLFPRDQLRRLLDGYVQTP